MELLTPARPPRRSMIACTPPSSIGRLPLLAVSGMALLQSENSIPMRVHTRYIRRNRRSRENPARRQTPPGRHLQPLLISAD